MPRSATANRRKDRPITLDRDRLRANLEHVRERIRAACDRADRDPGNVRLVAVTKYVDVDVIAELIDVGVRDVGENRPQALWEKVEAFESSDGYSPRWHMIGHLQRNKVRRTVPMVDTLHAGDSLRLLRRVSSEVERAELEPLRTFVQVNVSGEDSKHGFAPEKLADALDEARRLPGVRLVGLMTMAPVAESPEETRPVFRSLRKLRDEMADLGYLEGRELSMGMSQDFEVAIEEGATSIRVGSALYRGAPSRR